MGRTSELIETNTLFNEKKEKHKVGHNKRNFATDDRVF